MTRVQIVASATAGPDGTVRQVPFAQVRSDSADRLLPDAGDLYERLSAGAVGAATAAPSLRGDSGPGKRSGGTQRQGRCSRRQDEEADGRPEPTVRRAAIPGAPGKTAGRDPRRCEKRSRHRAGQAQRGAEVPGWQVPKRTATAAAATGEAPGGHLSRIQDAGRSNSPTALRHRGSETADVPGDSRPVRPAWRGGNTTAAPRRLSQSRLRRDARRAVGSGHAQAVQVDRPIRRSAYQRPPPRLRRVADAAGPSADGARAGQSSLAPTLRRRTGFRRRRISAAKARRRRIRNCSTGWQRSSSPRVGASRQCTG